MGFLRPLFKGLTGVAIAASMSLPALAQDAGNDAAIVTASVQPAKLTQPLYKDVSKMSQSAIAQELANVSIDKVAIVVWGGDQDKLQRPAWQACEDLVREGIPCALVVAPDHNSLPQDAVYQVYAKSLPQGEDSHIGTDSSHLVRGAMYEHGKYAYRTNYPQQFASLAL